MKLYLMRHGTYVPEIIDPAQSLSDHGREQVRKIAEFLSNTPVEKIFHSGKKRAQETAEIIGERAGVKVTQKDGLKPMDDVEEMAKWVNGIAEGGQSESMMLVGHLPFMGRLTSLLVFGDAERETISFEEATMVCVEWVGNEKWIIDFVVGSKYLI